jgi:hypothetical protein
MNCQVNNGLFGDEDNYCSGGDLCGKTQFKLSIGIPNFSQGIGEVDAQVTLDFLRS